MTSRTGTLAAAILATTWALAGCSDGETSSSRPTPAVSTASLPGGLQRVTYQGATVDVPDDWKPLDCGEFDWTQLGPTGPGPCGGGAGVAFYGSATYDPADGPGVISRTEADPPLYGGYAYGGDWAVYVQTAQRALTRQILASVEEGGQ